MNEVKDRVGFLREGLFAKYVVALVGLVVFVLAVNGAIETWITYRGIKSSLNDGMSEKAEATAKRIEQSLSDLERQISWVTRASSDTRDKRRDDYAQLLRQVPQVSQLSLLNAQGREQLRMTRQTVTLDSNADFSRDVRLTETLSRGTSFAPAYFRGERPFTSIALSHADGSITIAEIDLDFLSEFLIDAQVGKVAFAYVTDAKGDVLAASSTGPEVGKNLSKLPQVAGRQQARRRGAGVGHRYQGQRRADDVEPGAKTRLARVLRTGDRAGADADPRPAGADRAADRARPRGRDHRRHHHGAAHAGADHGAAGRRAASRRRRFRPPHRREDLGRTGGTGQSVQRHGRAARRDLFEPRSQGERADAGSGAVDQRAQGARGGRPRGRLLARPQRGAAHGRRARAGNHPCRRRADLRL